MNNNNKMIAERYMIVSSLGEGGMADVYLAIDTILNREVARCCVGSSARIR